MESIGGTGDTLTGMVSLTPRHLDFSVSQGHVKKQLVVRMSAANLKHPGESVARSR